MNVDEQVALLDEDLTLPQPPTVSSARPDTTHLVTLRVT
jgi:hypothetical protein